MTVQYKVHFHSGRRSRMELRGGKKKPVSPGRVPRISRLMALAIRFDGLIRSGVVTDQFELARLGLVTRARVTQIMSLLNLAPDIQEQLLELPAVESGRAVVTERAMREIVAELDWGVQRAKWERLCRAVA